MKMQFKLTFKRGTKVVAEVLGQENNEAGKLTIEEVTTKVTEAKQFLEKLTGLRVHVEQVL